MIDLFLGAVAIVGGVLAAPFLALLVVVTASTAVALVLTIAILVVLLIVTVVAWLGVRLERRLS